MERKIHVPFSFAKNKNQEEKHMSIYQEEMMRKLPKLGCTGTLDAATGTLSIRQNGVFLCQQLADGSLLYTDDEVTSQNFRDAFTAISNEAYRIREYVGLYEQFPKMPIPEVSQYRKFSEYGDTVLAGSYGSHGFMFCTWKQARNGTYVAHGDYTPDFEYAKESFITRSLLMDKNRMFSEDEANLLYRCIAYARDNCESLTYEQDQQLDGLLEKLTYGYQSLEDEQPSFDQDNTLKFYM